ncbi:hypothetical protein [Streptomyces sp. NPDC019937]|uniref:hypothetical protein n=1 Tax=Streptomyces sp. NPDC019937 TaxID=3154787 RepID=UPI0033F0E732
MNNEDELGYTPKTRSVSQAREQARSLSSEIFDVIGLNGETSKPGPGVSQCADKDSDKFYKIHHPWSLSGVPIEDLKKGMTRLKEDLPKKGWKIVNYGPNNSPAKNIEMTADSTKQPFSVNIELFDNSKKPAGEKRKSLIYVDLVSACFQVPSGEKVNEY